MDMDTFAANKIMGFEEDQRCYDHVLPILQYYKHTSIKLLTNSKRKYEILSNLIKPIQINGYKPIFIKPTRSSFKYRVAKEEKSMSKKKPSRVVDVQRALREINNGKPVIVVDDENRENEGDLIMPAEKMTPEWLAFYVKYTSGVICCALSEEKATVLQLPLMVRENQDNHQTAFTVSVDEHSCKTGISARERCKTCLTLATSSNPMNFRRPGHIFPLIAKPGGVRERAGHTEAGVELCKLCKVQPCAVISEIITSDGLDMATMNDLEWFAEEHELCIITIESLINYTGDPKN